MRSIWNGAVGCGLVNIPVKIHSATESNSVSKEISEKMAMEVAPQFNAELGLAITGYAETVPELHIKTCYAFIALAENGKIVLSKKIMGYCQQC